MIRGIDFRNARAVSKVAADSRITDPDAPRDRASIALAEAFFPDPGVAAGASADEDCPCFSA